MASKQDAGAMGFLLHCLLALLLRGLLPLSCGGSWHLGGGFVCAALPGTVFPFPTLLLRLWDVEGAASNMAQV